MTANRQVMPDDHSELEPPLPIPNRTVKRFRADDSAVTSVKVGYRQAIIYKAPDTPSGAFSLSTLIFFSLNDFCIASVSFSFLCLVRLSLGFAFQTDFVLIPFSCLCRFAAYTPRLPR